jgi:hypothetical protein
MTATILSATVSDPTLWHAIDMVQKERWLIVISETSRRELLRAANHAKQRGCTPQTVTRNDFPLPDLSSTLVLMGQQLDREMGLRVLRGFPIEGLAICDIELLYAGLTSHLGQMINQDTMGTLIDHVFDRGANYDNISVRGYTTNAQLSPHCDSGDLVGLLCIRPAMEGGTNNLSCAMAIYNAILESHSEYLEPLYRGFYYNIRGNGPVGELRDRTAHRVPVFSYYRSQLSCRFNEKAILTAEQLPNATKLTSLEKEAIACVAELAMHDDIRFDLRLESGDLLFLNNNTVLHNRDWFRDSDQADRKRLLLRQWINLDAGRALEFNFADHYNTGPRMGPAIHR